MLLCGQLVLRGRLAWPARAAAPQQPIILSRNGKDFKITANQSTVRAGTEIRVKTERPEVAISLSEMAKDSWVVFELPGFANATSGKQQDSIDALRKATETSYFKGPDAVWVKLVIPTAPKGRAGAAGPARAAAPQEPITLSRNGKDFKITANQSTVRAGTEIRVKTERPEVAISLSEMAKDSWVVFELPGFANATSGKQQDSIDALRKATETSYFKGPDAVWVKLVIPTAPKGIGMDQFGPSDTQTSITVRR